MRYMNPFYIEYWVIYIYHSGNKRIDSFITLKSYYYYYINRNKSDKAFPFLVDIHKIMVTKFNQEIEQCL